VGLIYWSKVGPRRTLAMISSTACVGLPNQIWARLIVITIGPKDGDTLSCMP
jgi:hypothetical protein